MRAVLHNGAVLRNGELQAGQAVVLEAGRIAAVVAEVDAPKDAPRIDLQGGTLVPGFIDTQVNGGGGVLFNDSPTVEGIAAIGRAHRRFGATGFLPTLITDEVATVERALAAADAAIAAGVPGVLGVHIEGPVLNPARKGIHDESKIIALSDGLATALTTPRRGRTLTTLAPERVAPADIARLVSAGVIVAAGHTNASYEDTRTALDAGVTGFTHLFNAMSPLTSRKPGAVGAALEDQASYCGLIVDGHHVDPVTLKIALRCRPLDRFMLVTDAMPPIGSDLTRFLLQGREIRVEGGVCVNADGTIAGSHLDMASAVRNSVTLLGLTLAQAVQLASANPAHFLGLGHELGAIEPGYRADLVLLDETLHVTATWIGGEMETAA
jgi:N-acetylglucosamine-6-phosphate deacetylase